MLVLSRKRGERVTIGNSITVSIIKIQGKRVQIGIEAPPEIGVNREKLPVRTLTARASNTSPVD